MSSRSPRAPRKRAWLGQQLRTSTSHFPPELPCRGAGGTVPLRATARLACTISCHRASHRLTGTLSTSLPTIWSPGTAPKCRLSSEPAMLSPTTYTAPAGTTGKSVPPGCDRGGFKPGAPTPAPLRWHALAGQDDGALDGQGRRAEREVERDHVAARFVVGVDSHAVVAGPHTGRHRVARDPDGEGQPRRGQRRRSDAGRDCQQGVSRRRHRPPRRNVGQRQPGRWPHRAISPNWRIYRSRAI